MPSQQAISTQCGPIECVIFDCDGTLVDSEVLTQQALVNVFAKYDVELSLEDCMNRFQGGKMTDILRKTCSQSGVSIRIDELEPQFRDECTRLFEKHLDPIPGVPQLLDKLKNAGIEVCVASNGPTSKMEHTLKLTGLYDHFHGKLFSAFDTNAWKPAPDLLLFSALNMAVPVRNCLFIDDTVLGVESGINANMNTIYFRTMPGKAEVHHPLVTTCSSMEEVEAAIFP